MSAPLDRKVQQAAAALAAGDPVRAERLCQEVLGRAPRHPQALQMAAAARLQQDDGAGACELFLRALAHDPANPRLLEGFGAAALKAGRFAEAESALRRAIALGRNQAATWAWLGIALVSQQKLSPAEECFRRALAAAPDDPGHWVNLGNLQRQREQHAQAVASYRRALAIAPQHVTALLGLGQALEREGKIAEAAEAYRRACEAAPGHLEARYRFAAALNLTGDYSRAVQLLEELLAQQPDHLDALNELGFALQELGNLEAAERCFRRLLECDRTTPGWWSNLGINLYVQGRYSEAAASFEQALALEPGHILALGALGLIRAKQGQTEAGLELVERAMRGASSNAREWWFLGLVLHEAGQYGRAAICYHRALAIQPLYPDAEADLGFALLYQQDFSEGWRYYEKRFDTLPPRATRKPLPSPRATGANLRPGAGRLAVWAEQGLGDEILYSSLIPELIAREVDFVYEINPRLLAAYRRSFPGARFVPRAEQPDAELVAADANIAAGSLPGLLRTSLEDFERQPARFLVSDALRRAAFRERLQARGGALFVAISWKSTGDLWRAIRKKKSAQLLAFAPLAALPGVQLVDVQYGDTEAERREFEEKTGSSVFRFSEVDHFQDIEGVLAILDACELVITTSNVTAHLAGALGKPVWLVYPAAHAPLFYWMPSATGRSLWYPSVEIITAPQLVQWEELTERAADKLREYLAARREARSASGGRREP